MNSTVRERSSSSPSATVDPLTPDEGRDAQGWHDLGLELGRAGRAAEAVLALREAERLDRRSVQVRQNLAVALAQSGELEDAVGTLEAVVLQEPWYFEARLNLGSTLAAARRHAASAEAYKRALALRPDSAAALNGLGLALNSFRRCDEAAVALRQATRLEPGFAAAHGNLGLVLTDQGYYAEAERSFAQALRLDPACTEAHTNRGNALKEQGRLKEAIAAYDAAIALNADAPAPRWNRALALLQSGDFASGWQEYEWRWGRRDGQPPRKFGPPPWDGSPPAGRTLLVYSEQGLGDVVQFARYGQILRRAGARVMFEAPVPLLRILGGSPLFDAVVPEGTELPPFDAHAAVMSLPRLCGTRSVANVPADVPYLRTDPSFDQLVGEQLRGVEGLKVGVAWQGNPHHAWDRHRSVPLARFASLAALAGVTLVSLQRGPGTEQLEAASPFPVLRCLDPEDSEADGVAHLASLIKAMDVVVTVDTLVAHLAGALAAPTWVLLSTMVDWRWMLGRDDSPWYPTVRLFRQRERGRWDEVFAGVAESLGRLLLNGENSNDRISGNN